VYRWMLVKIRREQRENPKCEYCGKRYQREYLEDGICMKCRNPEENESDG
jgi:ribosomal protein L37AE/L43A